MEDALFLENTCHALRQTPSHKALLHLVTEEQEIDIANPEHMELLRSGARHHEEPQLLLKYK